MPSKSPKLYDVPKTTVWFAIASVILLISIVGMVLQDSTRDWKQWQKKFMAYKKEQAQAELKAVQDKMDKTKLAELEAQVTAGEAEIKSRKGEITALQKKLDAIEVDMVKAKTRSQDLAQFYDSARYFYEELNAHGDKEKAKGYKKELEDLGPKLAEAKLKLEKIEAEADGVRSQITDITGKKKEAEKGIDALLRESGLIEARIKKNTPTLVTGILNAPMMDFIQPTLKVQQIVLEDLEEDFFYAKTKRVDRCTTCHLGIDQAGNENAPAPFQTHPRLDLFLAADSPHPVEEIGCTVCHGGSGHSANFTTSAHTPRNEEQAKEWKKKYNWHEMKHWTEKMLPLQHIEASCAKCHTGTVDVPGAPKLNEGRQLARTFGCTGCHKIEDFNAQWEVGPDLTHVQSKLEADWVIRWLHDPKEFRPSTKMPRIFHLSNTSDPESVEKSNAAIAGIATYLMKNSDQVELKSPPVEGNPEQGEKLINTIGCLGCHSVGEMSVNDHGPELTGMGSKVKADWLFTWLKEPKHYSPESRMPDLRLSDQEAADITSFLLQDKNEVFDSTMLPHVKPEAVDELALTFMAGRMRRQEAEEKLNGMGAEDRLAFVGKQSIAHQGCFGCHTIKGFENPTNIGTELTHEGSKEVAKLDFGLIHLAHTRQAWFFQKLKEPRIFDQGKVKTYHEKLRMPQFDFTDEQAEALTVFLLSLQKAHIPLEMHNQLDLQEVAIEKGRALVEKLNCQGCHSVDGVDGRVGEIIQDKGSAPPPLWAEGKKVQAGWLYHFLENPSTIRPWLQYRMPTFGFNEDELTTLVEYFNYLDGVHPSFRDESRIDVGTEEHLAQGRELFKMFQCIKCHKANPDPGLSASFLAPDLVMSNERLRPEWVVDWLKDPQALQPGTMMPGFFPEGMTPAPNIMDGDASKQMKAMRDYIWIFDLDEANRLTKPAAS